MIEAFGQTRNECIEEAVMALVESFIDLGGTAPTRTSSTDLPGTDDVESLISVLEEAIYIVDVRGLVPTAVSVRDQADGVHVVFDVVPLREVKSIGPAPKGIARHAIFIADGGNGWSCQVVVDV
jgi:protein archease